MVLDSFRELSDKEAEERIDEWFFDLPYLGRIEVLLRNYSGYSITKIESRGLLKLWKSISLEEKKNLYQSNWQYQR